MFSDSAYSTGGKPGCRSARHGRRHGHGPSHGPRGEFGGGPFGGFGPGGGGGPRGRGRRARRGDIRTAALLLLAEEPRNGYQIMQEVQERSGGIWSPSPGSVYPALQQLEDEGLIRTQEDDGRKLFAITDAGRALLEERGAERPAPWEQTDGATGAHELRKLVREVAGAFAQVMRTGSEAQIAKAGTVLAGTRRELYRILADGDDPVAGREPGAPGDTGPVDENS
ncbi:MAG TPA: PadR family transcriptional regulator [Solirubrobacteraceae bacterium]|jgi:DNA-binding PadR family transcriptional regulator|nr:PadR family transcriptional regulator [Solirubrobacteraceae bacterium]